jgi:hypothetical protein
MLTVATSVGKMTSSDVAASSVGSSCEPDGYLPAFLLYSSKLKGP